jgi:hypothetical protein
MCRFISLSSPAKAGDPVLRDIDGKAAKLRRTGYSAFAEYDGSVDLTGNKNLE